MYQSQKSNFSDHFFFKICIFFGFWDKNMKNEGYDLYIFGWVETNPVNFLMFFFIFWPQKFNISTRYPFHIQIAKMRQNP